MPRISLKVTIKIKIIYNVASPKANLELKHANENFFGGIILVKLCLERINGTRTMYSIAFKAVGAASQ